MILYYQWEVVSFGKDALMSELTSKKSYPKWINLRSEKKYAKKNFVQCNQYD